MSKSIVVVQASSRSWAGGVDICMGLVEGEVAVSRTLKRVLDNFQKSPVFLAAPGFDKGGELDGVVNEINHSRLQLYYGYDESPLNRLLAIAAPYDDNDYILRVDGIHFGFDVALAIAMLTTAQENNRDCVKMPDDFPVNFASEVYRVGALRKLDKILKIPDDDKYRIHPKCYFSMYKDIFNVEVSQEKTCYSDEKLQAYRELTKKIFEIPRQEVNTQRVQSGDRLGFHYELALQHLKPTMKTLDIACADGYGVRMLSKHIKTVHGADLDAETIQTAKQLNTSSQSKYFIEDVTQMSFKDECYDAITSFETIEHVSDRIYLKEIKRVLKPGGMFILSTPQNSIGHIPINSCHLIEYSLQQLVDLVSTEFIIIKIYGIKAGIIFDESDPYGSNTMLIAIKPI